MPLRRLKERVAWILRRPESGERDAGMTYEDLERDKERKEELLSGAAPRPGEAPPPRPP